MSPTKFDANFLDRRMKEHQRMLHDYEREAIAEIVDEVQTLPKRKPRSGQLFEVLDGRMMAVAQ